MYSREELLARVQSERLLAIVRLHSGSALEQVAEALIEGGITVLEFTLTTPHALDAIARCRTRFDGRALIGAGTVLNAEDARHSLNAGAQFLVSPGIERNVIELARSQGALAMPGALTPSEIMAAWQDGADIVKVFPARTFGPRYISDVRAPLPHIPLMPTGGIDEHNAADYLRAGAVAVALGGNLVDPQAVARGDWASISARARTVAAAVQEAK